MSVTQIIEPDVFEAPGVDEAPALRIAGQGPPVVFVHGWGATPRVYKRCLTRLAERGHRLITPTLPGFGGTPDLPPEERSIAGYAAWLGRYLDDAGISEPVVLVGHSFGGGISIQAAHDLPGRVARLVLVNSVGGGQWSPDGSGVHPIDERPIWDWGASALGEALPFKTMAQTATSLVAGFIPNVLRDPGATWRTAHLARRADLRRELAVLADRGLPVTLLWGRGDRVIPAASFHSIRKALRNPQVLMVKGGHGWLIHDSATFADSIRGILHADSVADRRNKRSTTKQSKLSIAGLT
ncbi:alpha/beta fold hydrolase [Rhodococcus sp. WMMA185]|uniref:alpha/beta fold hydrolase n=1 Tax=Rhodococcus sp. WMMA185 TaxID=679318 RepID=UPI0009FECB63|nr:alpha/beta hydrolase [Rhodococcus sp. WMMA185]